MKKLLITLLFIISSITTYSQTIGGSLYDKYVVLQIDSSLLVPRYLIGINGVKSDTIGIVITITQAQKIDNDLQLLNLYKSMNNDCDSTVSFLVQVVDDYKKLDVLAQEKFKAYDILVGNDKEQIANLNQQIALKVAELSVKDSIIKDKNDIISIDKLQITHLKKQRDIVVIGGVAITGSLIYFLFLK